MAKPKGKAKHPHDSSRPEPQRVLEAIEAGDMEALGRTLSVRQRRFAEEYVVDFNAAAAAIRAGYSKNYADRQGHILAKHKGITAYINHLSRSKAAKIVSVNPDYIIQQVTAIIGKDGAKDADRLRGLELLARHLGMFVDRTELTGKDGGPLEVEQRRVEEEADGFINNLEFLRKRVESDNVVDIDVKRKA